MDRARIYLCTYYIYIYIYIYTHTHTLTHAYCMHGSGGSVIKLPVLATPWTVAHQTLLSMEFPRQEYWSGLPFPSPIYYAYVHTNIIAPQYL